MFRSGALLLVGVAAAPASADWTLDEIRSLPGVALVVDFDDQDQVDPYVLPGDDGRTVPELTTEHAVSGASLELTIAGNTGSNACGSWRRVFGNVGENAAVSVQWRQRFSQEWLSGRMQGDGPKQLILSGVKTCDSIEFAMQNTFYVGFPAPYTYCGLEPLRLYYGPGNADYYFQWPARIPRKPVPSPAVFKRRLLPGEHLAWYRDRSGALRYGKDQWMTFQIQVIVGKWGQPNSVLNVWMGAEGKRSAHVIHMPNYRIKKEGKNDRFDRVTLTSYVTGKKASTSHPTAKTWYDNLIVRRGLEPIPDPLSTPASPYPE